MSYSEVIGSMIGPSDGILRGLVGCDINGDEYCDRNSELKRLDDIFQAFIETNSYRREHWALEDLLAVKKKTPFFYEHDCTRWRATVKLYDTPEHEELSIKFCNEGFLYDPRPGKYLQGNYHKFHGWQILSGDNGFKKLPFIVKALKPQFERACVLYNQKESRVDMHFEPTSNELPRLLMTWEPGYPEVTTPLPNKLSDF
jgi:hypothetical protein